MSPGTTVLYVDANPEIRSVAAAVLERTGTGLEVTTARSGREALSRLDRDDVDCLVSEYELPRMDGLELLESVRERESGSELPFILFLEAGSEELASEAISAGVTDYLRKGSGTDQYTVLADRIETAIEKRRRDRTRREKERELEGYRTLVETVDDPMYVLDEDGCCTIANGAFCELVDVARDRLVGEHIVEFLSRESFERGAKVVHRLYTSDAESDRFEFTVETDDGERRVGEANVTVLTDDDGEFAGSTAVVRDVTERKRRERELAQYERITALAPVSLFVLDADATITWLNDEFADAFAEDADELLGMSFPDLIDRGYYHERVKATYTDEVRKLLSSSVDKECATYDVRFRTADGQERIHDVHTTLLPLEDGEFTGTIHAIRDTTKQHRYQRELERQNERLAEFTSVVSHDLRNPLNVAQGRLTLHEEACPADDGESLEQLRQSLERMDDLIENLLSLARHGRTVGDREPVALSRLVREAWSAVDTDGATLVCSIEGTVSADEGRLRALLENLFRNAAEHGVENAPEPAVTVSVGRLEGDADGESGSGFYVADDGTGFESDPEDVFAFGHTTTNDGTGFGLGIVAEIAAAHGWSVTACESRDGGARFEIRDVTFLDERPSIDRSESVSVD